MSGQLAILGATGYTGRLCARVAQERGIDVVLAGRNPDKLGALARELGGPRTAVVDVTDGAALRALAESSDVLLTTVGPYTLHGRPALHAAIDGGAHYIDVSGEVPFISWVRQQDEAARRAGVTLCPGFGFDGFPGDLLAGIAAAQLGAPVEEARAAYLVRRGRISAGTLRTILAMAGAPGAAWAGGRLVDEPIGADAWMAPYPEPLGIRPAVSAPLPDVATLGPSTGAHTARAYMVAPGARVMPKIASPLQAALGGLMRGPVGDGVRRLADRLPEGPAPEDRARTRTAVLAEVRGGGATARVWCRLTDVYLSTAHIAVGVAQRLMEGTTPSGAMTPTQLFGPDAGTFLQEIGADWATC
jgi:short subunit dehydrogenase-like uncharacterized protein